MKLCKIALLLVAFYAFTSPVFAQEPNFAVSQEAIYQVHENGSTTVTQNFTFTNLSSEFFPQEYLLPIGPWQIASLRGTDKMTVTRDEIHVYFNNRVAGLGKILRWNLSYEAAGLAQKPGRLWQIFIPAAPKTLGLTTSVIRLIVPESFGQRIFANPQPKTADLFWDDLKNSSLSIAFDPTKQDYPYEAYNFRLKYSLYNSRLYPVVSQVTLPPDMSSQKIFLMTLSPQPTNVTLDQDGNWLAHYQLGPTARLDVVATGSAMLFLKPQSQVETPQKDWPSIDKQIKAIAQTLAGPKEIYNYVLSTFRYNPNSPRRGAKLSLFSPEKASAWDFSDLFITLARAKNIPARELNGFVTGRINNRHVWPQFYDQDSKKWVMVDPILNRFPIFDANHFVFAVYGKNNASTAPTEIEITPMSVTLDPKTLPKVTASATLPTQITAGFSASGKIFIENLGPTLFTPQAVSLTAKNLELENRVFLTGNIPPFGHQEFSIKTLSTAWGSSFPDIISLRFGLERQDYPVKVVPLYKNIYLSIFGGLIFLGIVSIIAQIARGLFFQKRQRRGHLRGQGQLPS